MYLIFVTVAVQVRLLNRVYGHITLINYDVLHTNFLININHNEPEELFLSNII